MRKVKIAAAVKPVHQLLVDRIAILMTKTDQVQGI
jgi:hypothetical protein